MKKRLFLILALGWILAGCSNDYNDEPLRDDEPSIEFIGKVFDNHAVKTRAEGLDSTYITTSPFNMDFYIQLNTKDEGGADFSTFGTYVVPSGYDGRLGVKPDTEELEWHDLYTPHTFYAWNLTWDPSKPLDADETDSDQNGDIESQPDVEPFNPLTTEPVTVKYYDSKGTDGFDKYQNNIYLENFVGAKSDNYTYYTHGKYVELTFRHLVSRIHIENFILLESSGAIQEQLQANITFINMPYQSTFYPHPEPSVANMPVVTENQSDPDIGLTYYIRNSPNPNIKDIFYVAPEIDFSNVDFMIELTDKNYENYKTYYGTFDDVIFQRKKGNGYDQGEDIDSKILHAGEEMTLNITLIPGVGPGLAVIIDPWSTDKPTDSQYHPYPGIYSEAELNEIRDYFMRMTKNNMDEILAMIEQMFELYGVTEDGKKYFMIYDNLDLTSDSNIFPVWKEYIINGLGHTITAKTNTGGSSWNWGKNYPYFNTGPVRDIYFTDPNGENTIYIDKEGFVWVTDKNTGDLRKTNNQLEDLNTYGDGKYNSYDINAETGQIRYSEYFNNNISG